MSIITNSVTFTIGDASPVATTQADVQFAIPSGPIILPGDPIAESAGALRELVYPGGLFPPIIYTDNPDVYTNFNTSPLDKRPRAFVNSTLSDNLLIGWLGQSRDVSVEERWLGSTTNSRMTLDFFLALQNYYQNPPVNGQFIQWWPRDRTTAKYHIAIESLSLSLGGGSGQGGGDYEFDYIVTRHGYLAGSVTLRFAIIGEA
jgi:hypothetical protein